MAIACGLDDTATMTGNRPVNQRAAMGFQRLQSADLIGLHESAVPDDKRREWPRAGAQPAFRSRFPPRGAPRKGWAAG